MYEIQKYRILYTECIYMFCALLGNSYHFPVQYVTYRTYKPRRSIYCLVQSESINTSQVNVSP